MKKIVFLDFETNGFQGSEVLSMSLKFNDGTEVNRFYFPKEAYNEQAISINGLTKDKIIELRANADYPEYFIDDKDIITIFQEIDILVAHNIEFDYSFLPQEIKEIDFDVMDTMKANTKYFKKNPQLIEAAKFYGIELIFDNLHGSAYDAEICGKIYNAMSEEDRQPSRLYLTKVYAGRDENGDMVIPFGSQKGLTAKKMTQEDARNFLKKYDSSLKHEMYELVLQRLHEFSVTKINDFFEEIQKFKELQKKQKQRGLNDYNMVNVVRKENAEVGMHSNVIFSLIDPNGLHYQDDLFLKLFIQEVLELDDFGEIISVKAEESTFDNRRIDFTIKSSEYYIGIEMKIDAHDLKDQLSHYEEDLVKKSEKDNKQKVFIYYLTKDGKEAAIHSHNNKITYETVSFKKHILNWIEKCQAEVKNITNLNEAFENYKDIVKKITNQYQGKVMALEDELYTNDEKFELSEFIHIAYLKALEKRVTVNKNAFFDQLKEQLGSKNVGQLNESRILIKVNEILKLQVIYERNELLATLFKDINGWYIGDYNDNKDISDFIEDKTHNLRKIGKYGYFTMEINPNIKEFKHQIATEEIENTWKNISNLLEQISSLNLQ